MLVSTSLDLCADHESLLNLARENGYVNEDICETYLGWSIEKFRNLVVPMIQEGIAWIDVHQGAYFLSPLLFGLISHMTHLK